MMMAMRSLDRIVAIQPPWSAGGRQVPAHLYFLGSAVFHFLGPACAVLLFASVTPLGVLWLRIATAALVFALWRRPWRYFLRLSPADRRVVIMLGAVLALMNACFYLAIARLPLATVGAIEFLGPIGLAAAGLRSARNFAALLLAAGGVYVLTDVRLAGEPFGYACAFADCALFVLYIVLGHRIAGDGGGRGIDRLGAAMIIATVVAAPIGMGDAMPAFTDPTLLLAGLWVGIASSVIPYVCDQLAMARLPRASFALLLSLLPATATIVGFLVLRQVPSWIELGGIGLVIAGVAAHRAEGDGAGSRD